MRSTTTHAGHVVDLDAPNPADIQLLDIAHHLATSNRFCGAALRPYSFAEHSLLIVEILEVEHGLIDPAGLLTGLLEYAPVAYAGDIPADTPDRMLVAGAVWERFDLGASAMRYGNQIVEADALATSTARRDLITATRGRPPGVSWLSLHDRNGFSWADWRAAFLDRAGALQYHRDILGNRGKPSVTRFDASAQRGKRASAQASEVRPC